MTRDVTRGVTLYNNVMCDVIIRVHAKSKTCSHQAQCYLSKLDGSAILCTESFACRAVGVQNKENFRNFNIP